MLTVLKQGRFTDMTEFIELIETVTVQELEEEISYLQAEIEDLKKDNQKLINAINELKSLIAKLDGII